MDLQLRNNPHWTYPLLDLQARLAGLSATEVAPGDRSRWAESEILFHLAVANGFPPHLYQPLFRELSLVPGLNWSAFSCPPRPFWGPGFRPEEFKGWDDLGSDLNAAWKQRELPPVVAVGHSFGAVGSLIAAIQKPEQVKGLILLDATIFSPALLRKVRLLRLASAVGFRIRVPIVEGARRRKRLFESREAAFEYFRTKRLFSDWPEEVLRLYVEHGLTEEAVAAGPADLTQAEALGAVLDTPKSGFTLSWSPEWEARGFATLDTRIWSRLPRLNKQIPVLFVRGEKSDVLPQEMEKLISKKVPQAEWRTVPGAGHLFPLSKPRETAAILSDWVIHHLPRLRQN